MIVWQDDCFGCDWHTCVGCPYKEKIPHAYCDCCGKEIEDTYAYRSIGVHEYLCADCATREEAFDEYGDLLEDEWECFNIASVARDELEYDPWDD